ncbi:MAG: type II toxin-antitoxin system HicA family toxin [Planctomycetaceae bacterium]|nr:type II toxin-antitoxin system HicA family toxin [Planctomycetaceae bacterium]
MGKIRVLSGAEVRDILQRHGFVMVRQRGSHVAMQKTDDAGTVTVPVPMHDELKRGTLRSIIRQSGIDRTEFES